MGVVDQTRFEDGNRLDVEVVVLGFDLTEEVLARDYACVGAAVVERKDQQRTSSASCDVATG